MELQFAECDTDLVQANLLALGFEFLIQQPVPGGRVVQRDLTDFLVQLIPFLLSGTARLRAVLMIAQAPVGHTGVAREAPETQVGSALPEDKQLIQRQSRRTFRAISSSSSFSARMRFRRSFSRSTCVIP